MKSAENKFQFNEKSFDNLFTYLRPLNSENARTIFKIFIIENKVHYLTTLDIQEILTKRGINLSKKEINGWLHTLSSAGLTSKEDERGKPSIIGYSGKYSFDLWHITDFGNKIAEGLPRVFDEKMIKLEDEPLLILETLTQMEQERKNVVLNTYEETNLLLKVLMELNETGKEIKIERLIEKILPRTNELSLTIKKFIDKNQSSLFKSRKIQSRSLKTMLMKLVGLSPIEEEAISLTEKGEKLAERLTS